MSSDTRDPSMVETSPEKQLDKESTSDPPNTRTPNKSVDIHGGFELVNRDQDSEHAPMMSK